jgi:hypothetical protein
MNEQAGQRTGDFDPDVRRVANVGKRFYTWATLGTFAGASFLVTAIWQILQRLGTGEDQFTHLGWPLLLAAIVVILFAFATEPKAQKTTRAQKTQKALITVANTLLVFFAAVGESAIVTA